MNIQTVISVCDSKVFFYLYKRDAGLRPVNLWHGSVGLCSLSPYHRLELYDLLEGGGGSHH